MAMSGGMGHGTGWWTGIEPYTIERVATLVSKPNTVAHAIKATREGIAWGSENRWTGPSVRIPWRTLRGVETSDSTGQKVIAGRVAAVGVFALVWRKKKLTGRIVFEAEDQVVAFDVERKAAPVLANDLLPITNRLEACMQQPAPPSGGPTSLADELAKLAQLHQSGILTAAEFEAQKARLLQG